MNILLTGFFGEGNLGDEAILRAIFANTKTNDQLFYTCGNHPILSGPRPVSRKGMRGWVEYLSTACRCSKAIFSGGMLQDWTFDGVIFFALRIIAADILGAQPSLWGAGVGPLKSKAARKITSKAIKHLKVVWLRDNTSLELFNDIKTSKSRVQAFRGADFSWQFKIEERHRHNGPMGLNLRPWDYNTAWKHDMAKQLRFVDRHIIGIAARKTDLAIIKHFSPGATSMLPVSFVEAAQMCQQFSLGIAMRYHLALAMLRSGLKVKLIGYDPKVIELAKNAKVELLHSNAVSGFKSASKNFIAAEQSNFNTMQKAFTEYLSQP